MNRKYGIAITVFAVTFFAIVSIGKEKIAGNQSPMSFEWEGERRNHIFRESAVLEIRMLGDSRPENVKIFINQKQRECQWQYDEVTQIYLKEQGKYKIQAEYRGSVVYTKEIVVELENPGAPKVSIGSRKAGKWSKTPVRICAYGSHAISGINVYEYKIGGGDWQKMIGKEILLESDLDDVVSVRAVSNGGRQGEVLRIPVRLWRKSPKAPILFAEKNQKKVNWYHKIPEFSFELPGEKEGPAAAAYFRLVNLETKDRWTGKDKIPRIKEDGTYQLVMWSVDEAGNSSSKAEYLFGVDTKKPQILIEYLIPFPGKNILKRQRAIVRVQDANVRKEDLVLDTTGKQSFDWKSVKDGYWTEVSFQGNRIHHLKVWAKDLAGNLAMAKKEIFETDSIKPEIYINGVRNRGSYRNPVSLKIEISDLHLDSENTEIFLNDKKWIPKEITKDGHYILRIRGRDFAGNEREKRWKFTLNQRGIQIAFLQKQWNGKRINHKNLRPAFVVESLEPVFVEGFFINGREVEYNWEENRVTTLYPIREDGIYRLELRLKDAAGNQKRSEKIFLIYDTKKPSVMIRGLDEKNSCEYGDRLVVCLQNRRDRIRILKVDGDVTKPLKNKVVLKKLEPGPHTLEIEAADEAGNVLKQNVRFTVTRVSLPPVKEILRKTKNHPKKKKEGDQKKVLLCLMLGFGVVFCAGIIKNRRTRL